VLFPLLEAVAPDVAEALEDLVELLVLEALPVEVALAADPDAEAPVVLAVLAAVVLTSVVEAAEETAEVDAEPVPLETSTAELSEPLTLSVQNPAPVVAEELRAPT